MTKAEKKELRKQRRKERKEKGIGFFQEFKKFILRGNVVDMAVGVIVASAFTKIVTTLNTKVVMPFVTYIIGGAEVSDIKTVLREEIVEEGVVVQTEIALMWGELIQAMLDFLMIALVIFIIVKVINSVRTKLDKLAMKAKMLLIKEKVEQGEKVEEVVEEVAPTPEPPKPTTEELLAEIRDLLKASQKSE